MRDERLSGYGTMDRVAPFDSAAPALARTLHLMTPVPEADRRGFVSRYARVLSPAAEASHDARAIVSHGVPRQASGAAFAIESARIAGRGESTRA